MRWPLVAVFFYFCLFFFRTKNSRFGREGKRRRDRRWRNHPVGVLLSRCNVDDEQMREARSRRYDLNIVSVDCTSQTREAVCEKPRNERRKEADDQRGSQVRWLLWDILLAILWKRLKDEEKHVAPRGSITCYRSLSSFTMRLTTWHIANRRSSFDLSRFISSFLNVIDRIRIVIVEIIFVRIT